MDVGSSRGAVIDAEYRYLLWRRVGMGETRALFIMLNPSTADAFADDATIRRCAGFAARLGHAFLDVCNLYAFRATDPRNLFLAADPIGGENDRWIKTAAESASVVIAAWGTLAGVSRAREVFQIVSRHLPIFCLGLTQNGFPRHPLYLRRDAPVLPLSDPAPRLHRPAPYALA